MVDIHGARPVINLLKLLLKAYRYIIKLSCKKFKHICRSKLALSRGHYDSMYQEFHGDYKRSDTIYCLLGSRDSKKTHGNATEKYFKRVLPKMAIRRGEHFEIDQLDGTCK